MCRLGTWHGAAQGRAAVPPRRWGSRPTPPPLLGASRWLRSTCGGGLPPRPPPPQLCAAYNDDDDGEGGSGDGGGPLAALAELRSKLQPLGEAFKQAVRALWEAQRAWLQHSLARLALVLAFLGALATAAANVWGLRALNDRLLPQAQAGAAALLQREVELGAVRWVSPLAGLLGLGPLASLGPVSLGAGPVERSSARAERLWVGLDLLQSALQRRVVLAVKARGLQLDLVQADNYSWFGYPEDTEPSARNFLPGGSSGGSSTEGGGGGSGGAGGGASNNGPQQSGNDSSTAGSTRRSSGRGRRSRSRRGASPAAIPSAATAAAGSAGPSSRQQLSAPPAGAASASHQLQALVETLTRELLTRGAAAAAAAERQIGQPSAPHGKGGTAAAAPAEAVAAQQQQEQPRQGQQPQQQKEQQHQEPEPQDQSEVQQPAMSLLGMGSSGGSSPGGGDMQHQPAAHEVQELARAAPGGTAGSGGSIFGGKISWGRAPSAPQQQQSPQPAAAPPSGPSSCRQQQLARLNAVRLQAGRGYTLLPGVGSGAQRPEVAGPAGAPTALGESPPPEPEQAEELQPAGHRSSLGPRSSEQQQQLQEQQHRKLHRRRGSLATEQQQQAVPATALSPRPAAPAAADMEEQQQRAGSPPAVTGAPLPLSAAAGDAAVAAALAGSTPRSMQDSELGATRPPRALPGSAASLNKQLRRLAPRVGSKLYSARGAAQQPAKHEEPNAGTEVPGASAAREAEPAALDANQAAAPAPPAPAAAEAAPARALPAMSAEQRRAAVAAINSLPGILWEPPRRRAAQPEAAPEAASSSSNAAASAAADSTQQSADPLPASSPTTRRINALGEQRAPDSLKPSARVSASAAWGDFAALVVDPATLHKKGGSAALPWAHQRPPASALIGSRLGLGKQAVEGTAEGAATAAATAANVEHAAEGAAVAASGEATFQLDATSSSGAGSSSPAGSEAAATGHRRVPLVHPGYFTPASGPSYTPAPPEALIDARNRRTTLGSLLRGALVAALSRLHLPEVAVGEVAVVGGTLDAHVHSEALPRRFADVRVRVRLGAHYDTLRVEVAATPYERHPCTAKCTMPSPHAHRHLRHVTGTAAARTYQQLLGAAAAGNADAAAAAAAAAEGRDLPLLPADGEAEAEVLHAAAIYSGAPTGGRVEVIVDATGINSGAVPAPGEARAPGVPVPSLEVRIRGTNLHAPLIERLIELPMDIAAGRANGELRLSCADAASWHFPEFYGRVSVKDAAFHFWDATDDITGTTLDLLFEQDRLYLHNAAGSFGAVPMTLTGDLDLNPDTGQYRLSAMVPGVEVNALRASLGVRPTPQPVAGALAGVLHVTGPLEKPVFSGTARGVRPSAAQLADCEGSEALVALAAEPRAVGAYDRVPLAAAGAVFALDTAAETLQLHSLHAELLDGGELRGSGRMWVTPRAEMDPTAVSIAAEGQDLAVEALARRYLPVGTTLPPGMVLGRASLTATMRGSHMEPTLEVAAALPEAQASCSATLRREAARLAWASPQADASGTVFLAPPGFGAVKAAITQAQATALARPNPTGLEADVALKGLDVVPLVSDEAALRQLAVQQSGQPVRLRLNGRVRVAGTVRQAAGPAVAVAGGEAGSVGVGAAWPASPGPSSPPAWQFSGDLGLESVRVNQLKLWQKLAGRLAVSDSGLSVHGKGLRPYETLDLDLALPLLASPAAVQPQHLAAAVRAAPGVPLAAGAAAEGPASAETAAGAEPDVPGTVQAPEPAAAVEQLQPEAQRAGGGRLQLRCGPLQVAADINAPGSQLNFKVAALKLDELELASLRGDLQEISCSLNFESHSGRGKLALANPRYSGLRGDSLSGGFRWERDVVRLEKLVLAQQRSRYEVQGEYTLPPNTPLPSSAADLALQPPAAVAGAAPAAGGGAVPAGGRWRVQVAVPTAELQEIVPAARLLQSATSLSPAEYEHARASFLHAIERASIRAADLNTQLRSMAQQLAPVPASAVAERAHSRAGEGARGAAVGGPSAALQLPGLQDVRGQWSGSVQAYGGGSSATSCDFDVKGQAWQWGSYGLDAVVAAGSYHSEEGLQLQEFVLKAGDAKLLVRGSLLGEHQDASVLLTDFPISTLRPIFRAVPALQHAAPAVPAERPPPVAAPRPLGMLTNALGRVATKGLRGEGGDADSPINGLLYVTGKLMGSRAQPTGEVAVRLFDAAVGQTRLQQATASARLSEHRQLNFSVEVAPAEGHRQSGHIKVHGTVPLAEAAGNSSFGSSTGAPAAAAGQGTGSASAFQQQQQQQQQPGGQLSAVAAAQQQLDVRLSVKDGGMAVLTSITPDLRWQAGQAAVDVRLRGSLERPVLSGSASVSKATLECPSLLRWPLTNVAAEVRAGGGMLTIESLEARCGRRGSLRLRGSLPVYAAQHGSGAQQQQQKQGGGGQGGQQQQQAHRLVAEASGLELRLRNMYSGQFDSGLVLTGSLASPTVAGSMRFSKGIIFIVPQGAPDVPGTASVGSDTLLTPSGMGAGGGAGSVARVFEILTRGESGLAQQFEAVMKQEVEAVEAMVEDAGQHNVSLDGLAICLGPDLRAMYPLVMNFGVAGELAVSGPAHPDQVRVRGTVRLPSGDVNLVATQLALDREHANLITFAPDQSPGLDPLVDLVMTGGDLRVAIQGKASEWQDHLTLHYISSKARPDSGEALEPADAARLFEEKLKAALLAEDGQLALSRLAGTTVSTLMPKIETQGQVGGTRWRLVSAPSIPGLLSLDPSLADPSNILSSITMGTEVEVQFGKKLQAAMTRKLQESDVTTQWSLTYKLNSKLRMQFNITSAPPFPKTLMFQFSSEGAGNT